MLSMIHQIHIGIFSLNSDILNEGLSNNSPLENELKRDALSSMDNPAQKNQRRK